MSFEGVPLKAGGNIAVACFIKISAANTGTTCSAGTDLPCGIASESVEDTLGVTGSSTYHRTSSSTGGIEYYPPGRICLLKAGAAVSAGAYLMSDGSGRGVTATTTKYAGAQALEAASGAGELIKVRVIDPMYVA